MFIELHDLFESNSMMINVNSIEAFWYDKEFDCICIAMKYDFQFRVKESYQEIKDKITKALSYNC